MSETETIEAPGNALVLQESERFISMLERVATNPDADVTKIKALYDMRNEERDRQAKVAFIVAMNKAQAEMQPIAKKHRNEHTKSDYAKLENVDEEIRPIYSKYSLSLSFDEEPSEGKDRMIICYVMHENGYIKLYRLSGELDISGSQGKATKTAIQGLGSTVSYLRRYLTMMIFNLVAIKDDNDGNNDVNFITNEQAVEIDLLIPKVCKSVEVFKPKFLEYMKVVDIRHIRANEFKKAMRMLDEKGKARE